MNAPTVLLASAEPGEPLGPYVDALLEDQRRRWAAFRESEAALAALRSKRLAIGGDAVVLQTNPRRRASVHARVEPAAIARRPCLLCLANLPPEERGVGFRDLLLLPNPHPVLPRHLTIASREHRPQRLKGRVEVLLELARSLGPEMTVFYNGARCGASAPDHFHFQSCEADGIPLLRKPAADPAPAWSSRSVTGRRVLIYHHADADLVTESIHGALAALGRVEAGDDEPMLNAMTLYRDGAYEVFLFPRARHRSSHYFAPESSRIAVSPGALEMSGILVLADPSHIDRLDGPTVTAILDEVTLDEDRFRRLVEEIR